MRCIHLVLLKHFAIILCYVKAEKGIIRVSDRQDMMVVHTMCIYQVWLTIKKVLAAEKFPHLREKFTKSRGE